MSENDKAYERILAQRAKRAAVNAAQGRSFENMGKKAITSLTEGIPERAEELSDVLGKLKERTNLENVRKVAEGYDPKIRPDIRGSAMASLRNNKGFAKLLPMLGLGGAALAASSMFNKAKAGDIGEAAMEGADLATDFIPGVGSAKMALQADELGAGEDQILAEMQQARKEQEMNNPESRRFAKIRQLMGK